MCSLDVCRSCVQPSSTFLVNFLRRVDPMMFAAGRSSLRHIRVTRPLCRRHSDIVCYQHQLASVQIINCHFEFFSLSEISRMTMAPTLFETMRRRQLITCRVSKSLHDTVNHPIHHRRCSPFFLPPPHSASSSKNGPLNS